MYILTIACTMERFILQVCLVIFISKYAYCDITENIVFPDTVKECYDRAKQQPINKSLVKEACWLVYLKDKNEQPILSDENKDFFKTEYELPKYGFNDPPTGLRIRKDVRVLTDQQRKDVFEAFNTLYQNGILRRFGFLHGIDLSRKHRGRAFLPWHRVFLAAFEEQLRKVNPTVSLPYWDYTTDYYMASPHKSVIWSDCFVGNGNGNIRSSQFADWYGGENVHIKRSTSQSDGPCPPKLINKSDMKRMLHHCYFKNITTGGEPYFGNKDNLEVHHDGIHDWVGGDMGIIKISPFDPIFWMHHAFIDYIWEDFRKNQSSSECNVDVETDYPETDLSQHKALGHAATDPLHGFEYLQIKDGLWKNWTTKFVNYEPQPQCPACGDSQLIYCDREIDKERHPNGVCVSKDYNACHSVQQVDKESHFVIERFDPEGFPGIGRTRGNADGENFKLLQQEIEREAQGDKTSSIKREDDGKDSGAWQTFGIISIIVIICLLLIIVYLLYTRNSPIRIIQTFVRFVYDRFK